MFELAAWTSERRARVESAQVATMAEVGGPPLLREAMSHSLLAGGKRLRPLLVLAGAEAAGGEVSDCLDAAQAVELIHTFSLIHDDLPCMDDDDFRRGRPSCHKVYGEAIALLAGDALMSIAFALAARPGREPARTLRVVRALAAATGPLGMVGGQILDMAGEGRALPLAELQAMHAAKTGALIVASVRMGALCAGADEALLERLDACARQLGVAFQIADDVLDVVGDAARLGKPVGSDVRKDKSTYAALLGVDGARAEAERVLGLALAALDGLGTGAEPLRALARAAVHRDH